jgi:hypothetical protein
VMESDEEDAEAAEVVTEAATVTVATDEETEVVTRREELQVTTTQASVAASAVVLAVVPRLADLREIRLVEWVVSLAAIGEVMLAMIKLVVGETTAQLSEIALLWMTLELVVGKWSFHSGSLLIQAGCMCVKSSIK